MGALTSYDRDRGARFEQHSQEKMMRGKTIERFMFKERKKTQRNYRI